MITFLYAYTNNVLRFYNYLLKLYKFSKIKNIIILLSTYLNIFCIKYTDIIVYCF